MFIKRCLIVCVFLRNMQNIVQSQVVHREKVARVTTKTRVALLWALFHWANTTRLKWCYAFLLWRPPSCVRQCASSAAASNHKPDIGDNIVHISSSTTWIIPSTSTELAYLLPDVLSRIVHQLQWSVPPIFLSQRTNAFVNDLSACVLSPFTSIGIVRNGLRRSDVNMDLSFFFDHNHTLRPLSSFEASSPQLWSPRSSA